ncbi:hypothetical protein BDZ97DRAFT_857784 [Flammula alnicola]|nr:hypothetical protein BDZ97DRAFT_857784 [Flammula alnicola]
MSRLIFQYFVPKYAFSSVGDFLDHYRTISLYFACEEYVESLLGRLPRNAAIYLTHGDLVPKNILVQGSTSPPSWTRSPVASILSSGNIAGCMIPN